MTSDMRSHATLPRLYVEDFLITGAEIDLSQSHAHYLGKVMRLKTGAQIRVFNGADGEWLAELTNIAKRQGALKLIQLLRQPVAAQDIWLLFAPVKKARTDFIVEKATELGTRLIQPVITKRTTSPKVRTDRMQLQSIEAAEQTERMDLPSIAEPVKLQELLKNWDAGRALIFADEAGDAKPAKLALAAIKTPAAILIGPEGGFTPEERQLLRNQSYVTPISLGPRILRADTAVAATLSIWQALSGDWR